ncbi:MAG: phosphate signaling complex protein PhoU [Rubellimicrobium sp.]|nr:phosphate signaling complex protein PhoU [Rubellimicrobium sp.]
MSDQHISSAFDRDLEAVQAMIMRMGGLAEQAILDGVRALAERDTDLAETVRRGDRALDLLEQQIQDEAARVIALRSPVSVDLRMVLTVMRLASGLERVGDYAKNIAKRTTVLAGARPIEGTDIMLRRMAAEVQSMLHDTLDAFIMRDVDRAGAVITRDEDVDQIYNSLFRELLTFMMEDPRAITPAMHLHFIAKNLERMGDLITNMAEQVIYLVTGARPIEERHKGDVTAFMSAPK